MAKDRQEPRQEQSSKRDEILAMAERLYERNWSPNGTGIEPNAFAAMCFKAARIFGRVASRINEGQSPDEIINQPQAVVTE